MIAAIADTHAVIWYLAGDVRLSQSAKMTFSKATQNSDKIGISAITLIEMVYLVEKGRIPAIRFTQLVNELDDVRSVLIEVSLTPAIARTLAKVDRIAIPDMPDRIIAATALHMHVPVISRDGKIQTSTIQTIW